MRKTEQPLEKRNTERPRRKKSFGEESDQLSHLLCSPESKARISFGKNMEVIGDFFFFFFLATLCGMQDLSSPTKDQNQASQSRSMHFLSFLNLFFN